MALIVLAGEALDPEVDPPVDREEVRALDHQRAPPAAETKWATAAHLRGLRHHAAVDLAVVEAVITRGPAAIAADAVWAAADTAVEAEDLVVAAVAEDSVVAAAAGCAAAAADAVEEDGGDEPIR